MAEKPKVSILIVNYNSCDFIDVSLFALIRLTKHPFEVFITDNNSKLSDYRKLKKIIRKYADQVTIHLERKTHTLSGSMAHGTALNYLVRKVDTPYFSILDADATWLKKDWDDILIKKMIGNVKVIGTQADPAKPQDFPLMFAILFETETFRKMNIDFRPKDLTKNQDTGWEIREKYLKADYQGLNIELKNTRGYKDGPFRKVSAVGEYYLEKNYNNIFASHFGRGSNPFAKQIVKSKNKFLTILLLPINYYLWKKDKKLWIRKCKQIIDHQ